VVTITNDSIARIERERGGGSGKGSPSKVINTQSTSGSAKGSPMKSETLGRTMDMEGK